MNRRMSSAIKALRLRNPPNGEQPAGGRRYVDVAAVLLLLVFTIIPQWGLLRGGTIVGIDSATQFFPWYSYL